MANLNVTDLPEETLSALSSRARAEGYSDRLSYVRDVLNRLVQEPITRERYAYRVYGQAGKGVIKRHGNHPNETSGTFGNFNQEEVDAFKLAEDLIRRNQPGDLVKALGMLNDRFEEVVEIPV
jgi:hypothetical protein